MPRRARRACIGAAAGVVLLAVTWYASRYVGFVRRADGSILRGFVGLDGPHLHGLTNFVASLCDPHEYVFLAAFVVIVAMARRRTRVAAMLLLILIGSNETTQLLKPLLAVPLAHGHGYGISPASWPSGHATAAMSLALCAVIAAPARRRPLVAVAMAAFAVVVSYSFLVLGWHYPSDVLGGFLVAGTWTLIGIAGLSLYEARRAGDVRPAAPISLVDALRPVAAMLAVAGVCAGLIVLARPHAVIAYAGAHEAFVVGACAIGALGLVLASGLAFVLGRG